jgi:hypothetical protein
MGRGCEVLSVAMLGRERRSGLVRAGRRPMLGSSNCSGEDYSLSKNKRLSCSDCGAEL